MFWPSTLLAGITVLLAAVQASRDERRYEAAILRALGAGRGLLLGSALAEFGGLGLLAGLLAATVAAFGGLLLARALELHYRFDALTWLATNRSGPTQRASFARAWTRSIAADGCCSRTRPPASFVAAGTSPR